MYLLCICFFSCFAPIFRLLHQTCRKYEEIYPPDVGEFVYITDDTYTKTQVLRMEQLILKVLGFDLSVPTTLVFTTVYCVMNDVPDKVKHMCMVSIVVAPESSRIVNAQDIFKKKGSIVNVQF